MMANAPPRGLYVPTPTFFHPDAAASLDLDTLTNYSLHLRQAGITGLILLGSTGEAVHISPAERHILISTIRRALPHPYPIIVGTATSSIPETITLLESAFGAGADFGLVLAPGYFASAGGITDQAAIIHWYTAIADASPIPILIYHYPAVTNELALHPHTLVALSTHPNIVGAKLSHGNVTSIARIVLHPDLAPQDKFRMFTGLGGMLEPLHGLGVGGAIDSLAGIYPMVMVALWEGCEDAHAAKRKELLFLQWAVAEGEELVGRGGVGAVKGMLRRKGWGKGGARACIRVEDGEWECVETLETMERELRQAVGGQGSVEVSVGEESDDEEDDESSGPLDEDTSDPERSDGGRSVVGKKSDDETSVDEVVRRSDRD